MQLVKRLKRKKFIIARCESCNNQINVPFYNTINPLISPVELKKAMQCKCGEYHNLITDTKSVRSAQPIANRSTDLRCLNCGSYQIHAGNKGFGLGKAAAGGLLVGPVGLLGGLIGSKKVMITCLECGSKWQAGKL